MSSPTTTIGSRSALINRVPTQSQWSTPARLISLGLAIVTISALAIYLSGALQMRRLPFPGFMLNTTMIVNAGQPTGNSQWAGRAAGIAHQDFIIAIDDVPLSQDLTQYDVMRTNFEAELATRTPGERIEIIFQRRAENTAINPDICEEAVNGLATCRVSIRLQEMPDTDFMAYFVLPFASGIIITILGLVVWTLRGYSYLGFTASTLAFASAIFTAGIFDAGAMDRLTPLWIFSSAIIGAALVALGVSFPTPMRVVRRWWQRYSLGIPFLLAGVYLIYRYYTPASPWDSFATQFTTVVSIVGLAIMLLLLVLYQRPLAVTPVTRDQMNTLTIGTGLMIVPTALWFGNRLLELSGQSLLAFSFESLMPLYIFPNAAVSYAVLQYRTVNTDRIISYTITYLIMVVALVLSNFLVVFGLSLIAQDMIRPNDPFVNAMILFFMVALFIPVRARLQERIDDVYFRTRRNYQQKVEEFTQRLPTYTRYTDITTEFRRLLDETIMPTSVFIFIAPTPESDYSAYNDIRQDTDIRFGPDSPLAQYLRTLDQPLVLSPGAPTPEPIWPERARLSILQARIVLPMPGTERLNGWVLIGPPRGKRTYDFEEVRFVTSLVSQLAIATERSQVIDSLERRVRELNVLSQVGQAVNFTIEFDDLLELIYAQTSKLVDAPCFYIALYEESINQMYFAFFLEGDDRVTRYENIRWPLGTDPFSNIVTSTRPIKLPSYNRAVSALGTDEMRLISSELQAWMGVPLSAGRSTLGVIAVGKLGDAEPHSDDEFKIFSDIGALAATSIEKARLFTQTRSRERQLAVLNDISRQLVATESDVEKLLQIIMQSSVEILNAEAGSLLLTMEDGSGDLEFRVVIGGAGTDLLGTRWERGKGIVGQVMESGQARIVNDAASDRRHVEDVRDKGGIVEQFRTTSLLAVPLKAKDDIIGVLEVLNKTDGTPFVEEDVELLTTFSGQAAVAIENARLFRMTDMQLALRVRELETLENFDNKLNRTLLLAEVAQITVNTAAETLQAQGGALGIINPPYLEIVALYGYEPEDYPPGSNGLLWSLEEGIVRRVMRNRQPDFAQDTIIDPDYTSGLRDSVSQLTLPMFSGDDINAILILERNTLPRFTLTDWSFAQRLAEHASIAIANAQLYAELMTANKSKSEFMGFAAHELKNPLSSVKGYSDLMLKGMLGDMTEQQRNFVNVIYSNANRMETIINDLRDSARFDANEFQIDAVPMHIHHAVIETLRPFAHTLQEKRQTLNNKVRDDLPLVMGDQTRIIQVLTNLVSNAIKYSPEDTTITLEAIVLNEGYTNRDGIRRGPSLRVSVIDQGIGMSEEDQKRLFHERYFRSTNQRALDQPGTGLGMTLSYGIIEKHFGDIWIESELEKGSAFHITLPLAPAEETEPSGAPGTD